MNDTNSTRVKLLRFPLIVLILYIHSFIAPINLAHGTIALHPAAWLLVVHSVWSLGIARVAVPLFFLMSGYLYFLGFDGSLAAYRTKTMRRVWTLLVPFLFWNLLVILIFALGQILPQTSRYFSAGGGRIVDATPFQLLDLLLGITHDPLAYPFWFIRDLMVIALVAPGIHWLLRHGGAVVPGVLLMWWFCRFPFLPVPSIEALTFFVGGAWLAQSGRPLFPPAAWATYLVAPYCAVLAADIALRSTAHVTLLYGTALLLGIPLALAATGLVREGGWLSRRLVTLSAASFFVFAAHEPLMTMGRKLIYSTLPPSQTTIFLAYALLPLLLAGVLTGLYFAGMRIAPRFIGTISGGR